MDADNKLHRQHHRFRAEFQYHQLHERGRPDISGATVNVGIHDTPTTLQAGDTLTLLDASGSLTGAPANA
ncbi:MAG: hypothetical protein LBG69_02500, partial [Zoogloeaceae bacterium]|nr:hypothetical protein [Zoogloeaceae bacterium]